MSRRILSASRTVVATTVVATSFLAPGAPPGQAKELPGGPVEAEVHATSATSPAQATPSVSAVQDFLVLAAKGWQTTPIRVVKGQNVLIVADGSWTMDYQHLEYVGPEGYPPEIDSGLWQGCKMDRNLLYAILLTKVGGSRLIAVGDGTQFIAPRSGWLKFRIHDGTPCLGDNDGDATATVTVW